MAAKYPGKGAGPRTVSQSRTMWVKKGEIVNGKKVEKGYLAQYGKPEKRVSASVKIVTDTESGKKAGEVYRYKAGRTVKPVDKAKGGNGPGGGGDGGGGAPTRKPKPTISMRSAERLRRGRNVERGVAPAKLPGGNAGMIPRPKGLVGAGRMSGSQAGLIDRRIGQAERVPTSDREAGGRGSRKPIMFANGTASVFDKNLRRRVTVGPKDPRHPKYKG